MASKEELLEKAKQLAESENLSAALAKVAELRRQWRRPDESESLYEQELGQKFEEYLNIIASKSNSINQTVEERKNDLIAKAKEVLEEKNFKKATGMMNDLMAEWKLSGHLEKEKDDELWQSFKEVRDTFFANRKEYYANMSERFAANKAAKEALIEEAKEVVAMENMKEATAKMNELMENWKKIGNAGNDCNDDLWKAFSAQRKAFYKGRDAYYASLRETFAQRVEQKKELIAEAKRCLANSTFSEEEVAQVKSIRTRWKEVGNAGRDNEENLFKEFNEIMNLYFQNMREYNN